MNLENIMLSENQTQKTMHSMILFIRNVQNRKIYTDRKKIDYWLPGAWRGGNWK
jgi:transcription initiation factor TFIID subunit TAF12